MLCSVLRREALRFEAHNLHTLCFAQEAAQVSFSEGALLTDVSDILGQKPTAQPRQQYRESLMLLAEPSYYSNSAAEGQTPQRLRR